MKQLDTVAIIGVGLIGGSIGLALRQRGLARTVVGIGRTASRLRIAEQVGAVSWATSDVSRGAADADLIVVCTPVGHVADYVRQVSRACRADALITDAGSTKGEICRSLAGKLGGRGTFVGSHPMAGSEKSGPEFADPNLFEDCVTVVTPLEDSAKESVERVEAFWRSLGARVLRMPPEEHDRAVAEISHLPHLVASALAACVEQADLVLAATGWRDTTRIASGDVELWRQIFTENRCHVLQSLAKFEKVLSAFRQALEGNDQAELRRLLDAGKCKRDTLAS
jgi:prephenate dehydrogenase